MNSFGIEVGKIFVSKYIAYGKPTGEGHVGFAARIEKESNKPKKNVIYFEFEELRELDAFVGDVKKISWLKEQNKPVAYKNQCAKCGLFFETRTANASTSRWECEKCKTWNDNELREAI